MAALQDHSPRDTTDTTDTTTPLAPPDRIKGSCVSCVSCVSGAEKPSSTPALYFCPEQSPDWHRLPYGHERGRAFAAARLQRGRCSCCAGSRWWQEAEDPKGWRCAMCHPPDGLAADEAEAHYYEQIETVAISP